MRRILTATFASAFLALALPAAASAHHHRRHHHRRAHTVVFRHAARPSDTTTPTTPTTEEPTATVESFEGGVLKIKLADGSTVTGKVTEHTWISCGCSHFQGGSQDPGDQGWQGGQGDDEGGQGWQGDDGHDGPGSFQHDDEQMPPTEECGVSSLVAGAKIKEADLNVSGAGAFWVKVILVPKS